jgi:hypothetical protein
MIRVVLSIGNIESFIGSTFGGKGILRLPIKQDHSRHPVWGIR